MAKKKELTDKAYLFIFSISMVLSLAIHFFLLARIEMHTTLHVFFSFLIFWAIMAIISILADKK